MELWHYARYLKHGQEVDDADPQQIVSLNGMSKMISHYLL
jgi:hypothetical protein